jgi:phosphoribosylanthranilate isomerase
MTADLPSAIKKVGVFVNEPIEVVRNVATIAKLDMIQLHGDEDMAYIRQLDLPVIKAVSSLAQVENYDHVILLFDSPKGGSGAPFDWQSVSADRIKLPYFIAGGLTADNVAEAIAHFPNAYGVDVSSGVETEGQKDRVKIREFIQNAKIRK